MENNEWKWVYGSLLAGVISGILIFIASGMDCMSGGCALMFISFFLSVSSFAVAVFFFTRARAMDTILKGENLLAHWVYPEEESRKSAEREYQDYQEMNRSLLYVVGGFLVIAMIGAVILGGEEGVTTAVVLLVVLIICAIVSRVAPKLERKRAMNASREAYITQDGIIYEGAVYPFSSFLMKMDGVRFQKETRTKPAMIRFSFIQLVGLYILRPFEINVPVALGEEENAQKIATLLGGVEEEDSSLLPGLSCPACGATVTLEDEFCEACGNKLE